ncbi:MAG: hypothetical protein H7A21_02535 [Spirochaetales bacterium]|nr:hypothetical protein [Spirochaetales bacterium]
MLGLSASGSFLSRVLLMLGLALLVLTPGAAHADMIFLRGGEVLVGEIEYQSPRIIRLRTSQGLRTVEKDNVSRISYDEEEEAQYLARQREEAALEEQVQQLQSELQEQRETLEAERSALEEERAHMRESETRAAQAEALYEESRWRSLVWPGWGQYHRGETVKGGVFMGAAFLTAFLWYRADGDYQVATTSFEENSTLSLLAAGTGNSGAIAGAFLLANEARNEKQVAASDATLWSTLFFGLYIYSALDAYLGHSPLSFLAADESGRDAAIPELLLGYDPQTERPVARVAFRIPL